MFTQLGGLFGWLTIISFGATVLNYVLKFIMKKFGKTINKNENGKKIVGILMKIFVKNHRYFGFAAILFLLLHFLSQFQRFGFSITGVIAAALLLLQLFLGMYGHFKHKKRKGAWFIIHRAIALLLILGIALHLLLPWALSSGNNSSTSQQTATATATGVTFTLDELATYNGQNGQPAYVAYNGVVYDVSNVSEWRNGSHNGHQAGTDLTSVLNSAPHGTGVITDLPVVGTLIN